MKEIIAGTVVLTLVGAISLWILREKVIGDTKTPTGGSDPVRAIRNNNPGNIRISGITWNGELDSNTDGEFEQFESLEMGARAQLINLRSYFTKHGIDTVRGITNRWSPAHENPTSELVEHYSERLGVLPDDKLEPTEKILKSLSYEIAVIETGRHPKITRDLYNRAYDLI